ncbi:MAG: hypothetical protein ABJA98_32030 [Acidobacteriota bacterium]
MEIPDAAFVGFAADYYTVMSRVVPLAIPNPASIDLAALKSICLHVGQFPEQADVYAAAWRLYRAIELTEHFILH